MNRFNNGLFIIILQLAILFYIISPVYSCKIYYDDNIQIQSHSTENSQNLQSNQYCPCYQQYFQSPALNNAGVCPVDQLEPTLEPRYNHHKNSQPESFIHSILKTIKADQYLDKIYIDYTASFIQFIAIICCAIYPLRDEISSYLHQYGYACDKKSVHKQQQPDAVHFYPSPDSYRARAKAQKEIRKPKDFSTFSDGLLLITLQIAILSYVGSALSFTPWHEGSLDLPFLN